MIRSIGWLRPFTWALQHRTAALACCGLLAGLGATPALATIYTDLQLAQLPADSVQYTLPGDAGEATLTISEIGASGLGTMRGSDLFGFQGLWLGSPGLDGSYRLSFNRPVAGLRLSFIALTALGLNGEDGIETLGSFVTDQASLISFSSANASSGWDGATVTPLDEDGRGALLFQAQGALITSLRFDHLQPVPLNGFVINRIEYSHFLPEPSTAWMGLAGLLALLFRLNQRPPVRAGFGTQWFDFVSR